MTYKAIKELGLDFAITFVAAIQFQSCLMNIPFRPVTAEGRSALTQELQLMVNTAVDPQHAERSAPVGFVLQLPDIRDFRIEVTGEKVETAALAELKQMAQ